MADMTQEAQAGTSTPVMDIAGEMGAKPWYKKWWIWLIVVGVLVVACLAIWLI